MIESVYSHRTVPIIRRMAPVRKISVIFLFLSKAVFGFDILYITCFCIYLWMCAYLKLISFAEILRKGKVKAMGS